MADVEAQLLEDVGGYWNDPLGFVLYGYEWNSGELQGFHGPDTWQRGFLREWGEEIKLRNFDGIHAVDPVQMSTVSGHGIGKSAMAAWICDFIPSTRPYSKGIVTANTSPQLETKTWAEVAKWTRRCITGHWFKVTTGRGAMKKVHRAFPDSWRVDALAWTEGNPEAFAGQHAVNSSSWYLFDEASAIARQIYETAQGGMTDGEPMQFLFGNGTKNSGFFYDTHHSKKHLWRCFNVDARNSMIANKALHEKWIEEHGIDSDFVKVKVRGMFPNQSADQFISTDLVQRARKAQPSFTHDDPLIMGVDVGRGGDPSVIRFRRGRDARTLPKLTLNERDLMKVAAEVVRLNNEFHPDAIFIDANGVGGGVVDRCRELNCDVIEIFSSFTAGNKDYRMKGDEMWGNVKHGMNNGLAIEDSQTLEEEFTSREYFLADKGRIALESKDDLKSRGQPSPNDADALALTYAYPVGPRDPNKEAKDHLRRLGRDPNTNNWDYDPHSEERLHA